MMHDKNRTYAVIDMTSNNVEDWHQVGWFTCDNDDHVVEQLPKYGSAVRYSILIQRHPNFEMLT